MVDRSSIEAAVGKVLDPHINVPLTEMGMLSDVVIEDDAVEVSIVFPCLGCPAFTMLKENIKQRVRDIDGVERVKVSVDWGARWDRSQMSSRAKRYAAERGYRI